jgi:hypothetical protein
MNNILKTLRKKTKYQLVVLMLILILNKLQATVKWPMNICK